MTSNLLLSKVVSIVTISRQLNILYLTNPTHSKFEVILFDLNLGMKIFSQEQMESSCSSG